MAIEVKDDYGNVIRDITEANLRSLLSWHAKYEANDRTLEFYPAHVIDDWAVSFARSEGIAPSTNTVFEGCLAYPKGQTPVHIDVTPYFRSVDSHKYGDFGRRKSAGPSLGARKHHEIDDFKTSARQPFAHRDSTSSTHRSLEPSFVHHAPFWLLNNTWW